MIVSLVQPVMTLIHFFIPLVFPPFSRSHSDSHYISVVSDGTIVGAENKGSTPHTHTHIICTVVVEPTVL